VLAGYTAGRNIDNQEKLKQEGSQRGGGGEGEGGTEGLGGF